MLKTLIVMVVLILAFFAGESNAQEQQPTPGPLGEQATERPTPMPMFSMTIPGDQNDEMQALKNPSVLRDLEIVEVQTQEIAKTNEEFAQRHSLLLSKLIASQGDAQKSQAVAEEFKKLREEKSQALSKILLPHQIERIKQVSRQIQINSAGGVAGAMQHGPLAKVLSVTDEQKKRLEEIQKRLKQDIAAKTRELKESAREEVLAMLSINQRSKYNKFVGEKFEEKEQDWNDYYKKTQTSRNPSR